MLYFVFVSNVFNKKKKKKKKKKNIYDVLEEADRALYKKISSMPGYTLYPSLPKIRKRSLCLRVPSS